MKRIIFMLLAVMLTTMSFSPSPDPEKPVIKQVDKTINPGLEIIRIGENATSAAKRAEALKAYKALYKGLKAFTTVKLSKFNEPEYTYTEYSVLLPEMGAGCMAACRVVVWTPMYINGVMFPNILSISYPDGIWCM
jgi:hypothetical protein